MTNDRAYAFSDREGGVRSSYMVDFYLDGSSYDVHTLRMSLSDSGIPTIVVGASYGSQAGDWSGMKYEFDDVLEFNCKLQALRWKKDVDLELDFNFGELVSGESMTGSETEVSIREWIVVDSGVTNFTTGQSPRLQFVLQHPACLLKREPLAIGTEYVTACNKLDDKGNNVLESLVKGMERYLNTHDPDLAEDQRGRLAKSQATGLEKTLMDEDRIRVARARQLLKELPQYLEWGVEDYDYPFDDIEPFKIYLKKWLVHSSRFRPGVSIYDLILQHVSPMLLSINGGFSDDPMRIELRNPWGNVTGQAALSTSISVNAGIPSEDIHSADLPLVDEPMKGLVMQGKDHFGGLVGFTGKDVIGKESKLPVPRTRVLAAKLDLVDVLDGKIVYTHAPQWLVDYQLHSRGSRKDGKEDLDSTGKRQRSSENARKNQADNYKKLLDRYVEDLFFERFHMNSMVSLTTSLSLKIHEVPGQAFMRPGDVVDCGENINVYPEESGIPDEFERFRGMRFRVTHVSHHISVPERSATTSVAGSHCRDAAFGAGFSSEQLVNKAADAGFSTAGGGVGFGFVTFTPPSYTIVKQRELITYTGDEEDAGQA